MTLLIRAVSLRKSFSLPMCFIQGFWPVPVDVFNLSSTASVTNCRRGMPRSAAFDFARRKIVSGISNLVFTFLVFPYLWEETQTVFLQYGRDTRRLRPRPFTIRSKIRWIRIGLVRQSSRLRIVV